MTLRRRGLVVTLALATLVSPGCVSGKKYDEVVSERDRLALEKARAEDRLGRLETSNASLDTERVRLIEEVEDLAEKRVSLESDRSRLSDEVDDLRATEAELGEALAAVTHEVDQLQSTYQGLVRDLETEVAQGAIEIEQLRDGLRVAVADEILFRSGSARLGREGQELLETVAGNLQSMDYTIEVIGHTDNVPIRGLLEQRYPTNWELAGARAAQVVRLFLGSGISGERLRASSRAEFEPVAGNETDEDRSLNRRIEILLRPVVGQGPGMSDSPAASSTPAAGMAPMAPPAETAETAETAEASAQT